MKQTRRNVRTKKKNRPSKRLWIGLAVVGAGAISALAIYLTQTGKIAIIDKESSVQSEADVEDSTGNPNYIKETAFDGSEDVDKRLFNYPYPTESEGYVSNKKLYEELGDYKMNLISQRANEIGTNLFSFDYRTVRTDYDHYFNNLSAMFRDVLYDDDADQNVVLSEMVADFSDAELQMTADYKTSKFMVYDNGMATYVRGILNVYVWSCSDIEKASKYFPAQLKVGEDNTFVYEIEILNSMDSHLAKDMQIFDYYDCKFLDVLNKQE